MSLAYSIPTSMETSLWYLPSEVSRGQNETRHDGGKINTMYLDELGILTSLHMSKGPCLPVRVTNVGQRRSAAALETPLSLAARTVAMTVV